MGGLTAPILYPLLKAPVTLHNFGEAKQGRWANAQENRLLTDRNNVLFC